MLPSKTSGSRHTLAICTVFANEDPYLLEWLQFHQQQGVKRFYLYDNGCSKDSQKLLQPLIKSGLVCYQSWPDSVSTVDQGIQREAYRHCLVQHGHHCEWIVFMDVDEFLYSTHPTETQLDQLLLRHYSDQHVSQIEVPRYNFGNHGHQNPPGGGVLNNYFMREKVPSNVKSLVRPVNIDLNQLSKSVHRFDNLLRTGRSLSTSTTVRPLFLKINHYLSKSTAEFLARREWWKARSHFNHVGSRMKDESTPEQWNQVLDRDILSQWRSAQHPVSSVQNLKENKSIVI